ncbi:gibberellin 2-beta-dioxygenase 6-like [Malania oleifera]|uniref:gibberellin 2-beta-dioxygenase 6-like n=1 Tax=Malania oleifera TaxID=397392 RepID=UPI0025AE437C|nr:gibberellin 2-beta-dioxygenase 6-like [Malania oleifera]
MFQAPDRIGKMVDPNPPLLHHYGALLHHHQKQDELKLLKHHQSHEENYCQKQRELPLVDLGPLISRNHLRAEEGDDDDDDDKRVADCAAEITRAASEWGFFQVVNHGISPELLQRMTREQVKLFQTPFERKLATACSTQHGLGRLLNGSYRWGSPAATSPHQFSWSESFQVPIAKIRSQDVLPGDFSSLREVMEELGGAMSKVAGRVAGVLAESMGQGNKEALEKIWDASTCSLRLNRYPPCALSPEVFGLIPHTDSDFLTILYQDHHVGGLHLRKDSHWIAVKPTPHALVVNIGDLFQAWSNDVFKSVEHKVTVNEKVDRYSVAFFLSPSPDSLIGSCREPSLYRKFTFGEYRNQVQEDVTKTGNKIGLHRFRL